MESKLSICRGGLADFKRHTIAFTGKYTVLNIRTTGVSQSTHWIEFKTAKLIDFLKNLCSFYMKLCKNAAEHLLSNN